MTPLSFSRRGPGSEIPVPPHAQCVLFSYVLEEPVSSSGSALFFPESGTRLSLQAPRTRFPF